MVSRTCASLSHQENVEVARLGGLVSFHRYIGCNILVEYVGFHPLNEATNAEFWVPWCLGYLLRAETKRQFYNRWGP